MSNYPDDIRNYDNHPGSPFYTPPAVQCKQCGTHFNSEDALESKYNDDLLCSHKCLDEYEEEYEEENSCPDCKELECVCE